MAMTHLYLCMMLCTLFIIYIVQFHGLLHIVLQSQSINIHIVQAFCLAASCIMQLIITKDVEGLYLYILGSVEAVNNAHFASKHCFDFTACQAAWAQFDVTKRATHTAFFIGP
jgi:hypothetical protein